MQLYSLCVFQLLLVGLSPNTCCLLLSTLPSRLFHKTTQSTAVVALFHNPEQLDNERTVPKQLVA
jgi:hypothetical protein